MTGKELLLEAAAVVRARRRLYGEPAALFERVAVRWSQVLKVEVTAAQVCMCLIDLKLSRLAHDPAHLDSLVDVAGYAACMREAGR
jgi:hypothetical protein